MKTNDLDLESLVPDERFEGERSEELLALLVERTARYTMGDSTSVRVETAARLLEGILYCLNLSKRSAGAQDPNATVKDRFFAGVREAERLKRRAALLYAQAKRFEPPVVNLGYTETCLALSGFFRQYDPAFFAQEIPCAIDYPLCQPVSERLKGVEYLLDYLKRWLVESSFLRMMDADSLRRLYAGYYADDPDLLVNLYLPAAEAASLCALAGRPVRQLTLRPADRERIVRLIDAEDASSAKTAMCEAAEHAGKELNQTGEFSLDYLKRTALDLLTRLRVNRSGKVDKAI